MSEGSHFLKSGASFVWCMLHGRLGNNLFQYAAAATLARRGKILLDYSKTGMALTRRKIAQEDFHRLGLPGIVVPPLLNRIVHRVTGRHLYQLGILPRMGDAEWVESDTHQRKSVMLEGYFQQASTAEHAPEGFRDDLLERLGKVAGHRAIKPEKGTVAVHVRRGDYLPHDSRMVCGQEYFLEAMRRLRKLGGPFRFLVFSDDPAWCMEHLAGPDVDLAPPELEKDAIAALHGMALCDHQIISNSTFSWWAAWLNPNPKKIVVGPDRWDTSGTNSVESKRFSAYHTLAELAESLP